MYLRYQHVILPILLFQAILFVSQVYTNPYTRQGSFAVTNKLQKREDLATLWKGIKNKVGVGRTQLWRLDPTQAAAYTTEQFYGCTVVLLVDGKRVLFGHYGQESGRCVTLSDNNEIEDKILSNLGEELLLEKLGENTQVWIMESQPKGITQGFEAIAEYFEDDGVPVSNIRDYKYFASSGTGEFPGIPKGKAVVTWTPRSDGSGATMNVYIEKDTPTFTQDYDCNGNPIPGGNHKRDSPACTPTKSRGSASGTPLRSTIMRASTIAPPTTTPLCTYMGPEPPVIPEAYCSCGSSSLPLTTIPGTPVPEASSCNYNHLPNTSASIMVAATVTTNVPLCQICTPRAANEDACTSMTSCIPQNAQATVNAGTSARTAQATVKASTSAQTAQATVKAGTSAVHVGTLTSTALYTSMSSALEKLCPSVTQTNSPTVCETGTAVIPDIVYSDSGTFDTNGEIKVTVEFSSYNVTSLRDAMIQSAALAVQESATGSNCYTASYDVEQPGKRDLDTRSPKLAAGGAQHNTWCNGAGFAGAEYYSPYAQSNATDLIYAHLEFAVQGGDYNCEFVAALSDALIAVAPEFSLEDVELGEDLVALCESGEGQ